jgi:hypothetical protein
MQAVTDIPRPPKEIPRDQFARICNAIGDQIDFKRLDDALYDTFLEHKINEWSNPKLPPHEIARDCLDGVRLAGKTVQFLAQILKFTPRESILYQLIVQAVPEAEAELGPIAQQMPAVVEGLKSAGAQVSDQAVKAELAKSRSMLEDIPHVTTHIECYKGLHDCLHVIQMKPIAKLLSAVRTVKSEEIDSLREYQDQAQSQVESARYIVQRLPDDSQSMQSKWIDRLADVVEIYGKAQDRRDSHLGRVAVIQLSQILWHESNNLNQAIVAETKRLPLNDLRATLERLSAGVPTPGLAIPNAVAALSDVENALHSRVAEHDRWQTLDNYIWTLDDFFTRSPDPAEDFIAFWPEVKASLRSLIDLAPDAKWSSQLLESAAQIENELLRLEAADATPAPESMLGGMFSEFRRTARMRFFQVDRRLLEECGHLGSIGEPVAQILRGLGGG